MIRHESSEVVNLDDPEMWLRVCFQLAKLFRRVMLVAFKNLAIAQHKDTLRYVTIRGGGYRPLIRRFHVVLFAAECTNDVGCNDKPHYLMSARGVSF
jgi:hypothetical protein